MHPLFCKHAQQFKRNKTSRSRAHCPTALCKLCAILDRLCSETAACITEKLFTFSLHTGIVLNEDRIVTAISGGILKSGLANCDRGGLQSVQVKVEHTYMIYMRVGTLIVATIYLQLIQNRYMFRSFTVVHCSHQHCVQPVASDVEIVGYL